MKLDNKGFAITTILYGILILFLMLLSSMLSILASYKDRLEMLIENSNGARDIINKPYIKYLVEEGIIDDNTTVYTVKYDANGGNGIPEPQIKTAGVTLTLSSVKPSMTGYTFLGWDEDKTAMSATYEAGGTFEIDADTILYAVWSVNEVEKLA